jgi:hypothetical protein
METRRQHNMKNPYPLRPRWHDREHLHHHSTHGHATGPAAHQRGSPTWHRTQRRPLSPPTRTQPTHNNPWVVKTATRRDILRLPNIPPTPIKATHPSDGTPPWNRNQACQPKSQRYPNMLPPPHLHLTGLRCGCYGYTSAHHRDPSFTAPPGR